MLHATLIPCLIYIFKQFSGLYNRYVLVHPPDQTNPSTVCNLLFVTASKCNWCCDIAADSSVTATAAIATSITTVTVFSASIFSIVTFVFYFY